MFTHVHFPFRRWAPPNLRTASITGCFLPPHQKTSLRLVCCTSQYHFFFRITCFIFNLKCPRRQVYRAASKHRNADTTAATCFCSSGHARVLFVPFHTCILGFSAGFMVFVCFFAFADSNCKGPSAEERAELVEQTKLTSRQVTYWCILQE